MSSAAYEGDLDAVFGPRVGDTYYTGDLLQRTPVSAADELRSPFPDEAGLLDSESPLRFTDGPPRRWIATGYAAVASEGELAYIDDRQVTIDDDTVVLLHEPPAEVAQTVTPSLTIEAINDLLAHGYDQSIDRRTINALCAAYNASGPGSGKVPKDIESYFNSEDFYAWYMDNSGAVTAHVKAMKARKPSHPTLHDLRRQTNGLQCDFLANIEAFAAEARKYGLPESDQVEASGRLLLLEAYQQRLRLSNPNPAA